MRPITLLEICDQWVKSAEDALTGVLRREERMKILGQRDRLLAIKSHARACGERNYCDERFCE